MFINRLAEEVNTANCQDSSRKEVVEKYLSVDVLFLIFWHAPLGVRNAIIIIIIIIIILNVFVQRHKVVTSAFTEDGSGPGRLLRSV